jgi:amino acid adenylation domain-containing protein
MDRPSKSIIQIRSEQAISARRISPTNLFVEFTKEEVEQSVPDRFKQMVARYPHRIAVKTRSAALTYNELDKTANRLARAILALRGAGEEPVALFLDHDVPMIAAILGVLKTGKICVPLDPSHPEKRAKYILEDSQAAIILTNNKYRSLASGLAQNGLQVLNLDSIGSDCSTGNLSLAISPDTLSYIVYTSGSTGQPKGVTQNHRNILHNALRYTNNLHICSDDRVTLLASLGTGQGVPTAFCTLLNGATLCPFNVKEEGVARIPEWLIAEEISVYVSASTVFRHFTRTLTRQKEFPKLRLVRLGAEQVRKSDVELYKKHFSPQCIFGVTLSATESGNYANYFLDKETEISGDRVSVGYVADDMEILLLDDEGKEVGFNETGEIAVKSRYLSPGYWRNPDLTRATFLPDPKGGTERIYRTGDLGLMRPDGCLEHHGRKGSRVKIRGFRVELEEIETLLNKHPAVREVVIEALEDESSDTSLVAYIAAKESQTPTAAELRKFLREQLPEHMVPSAFVFLEAFPLTPIGKIDRKALPAPNHTRSELQATFVAARTPVEKELVRIWTEVLGVEQVGIHDNFFDLGGNSLRLAEVNRKVCEVLGKELPLIEMFGHPTISNLADYITQKQHKEDALEQSHYRAETRRALKDRSTRSRRIRKEQDE